MVTSVNLAKGAQQQPLCGSTKVAKGEDIMGTTYEPNISVTLGGTQEVVRKKPWRFATAFLVSLAAVMVGLLIQPSVAMATDRLTDKDVEDLLAQVENTRSKFEAALDKDLKNTVLQGQRADINTNEFFDDLQDQVKRTRERFKKDYSASSEVIALLGYATRLDRWVKTQPAGFRGSIEWEPFASDLRRLAAAYNTTVPMPAAGMARRFNDTELVAAAAAVEKLIDPFRHELELSLTTNKALSPEKRQSTLLQVDTLRSHAHALNLSLANKQKGVAEADGVIKQALYIVEWIAKNQVSSATRAAWTPLRGELAIVALSYEVNNRSLPLQ
jgi:hypothetical protein